MKVLVLANEDEERSLLQEVLRKSGHEMLLSDNAEHVLEIIERGEARFVIADADTGEIDWPDLIGRVRASGPPPIYFLLLTSREVSLAEADDTLRKPFSVAELKARITIGQRFLSLGDDLLQARRQIENLAIYDELTGMMNRAAFYRSAQGELERARRSMAPLSLIALNIDNFKALHDSYGASAGNEVLQLTAQVIREKSRPYDPIGRWSHDEFVIALPGVIGPDAEKIAERILRGVHAVRLPYDEAPLEIGLSAGVASAARISAATEIETLLQQAFQAMRRARENGGNQVNLVYL